jgi:hypothetical protein
MMRSVYETETGNFAFTNHYFHFEGTTLGGKPHGSGVLLMGDGTSLTGTFTNGDLNGEGCKRWEDGSFYVGPFVKGEMHGVGRWVRLTDGTDYRGDIVFGVKEGFGKEYDMKHRRIYEGPFYHGRYHGTGTMLTFPTSSPINVELSPRGLWERVVRSESEFLLGEDDVMNFIPLVTEQITSTTPLQSALDNSATSVAGGIMMPAAGGSLKECASSSVAPPVGFLPPSAVAMALRRIKSVKLGDSQTVEKNLPTNISPEPAASTKTSPLCVETLNEDIDAHHANDKTPTILHGPFVNGRLHGDGVTIRFANGDVFDGAAVHGELQGPHCEFLALCAGGSVPIQYCGPMLASRRAEVPSDIIIQDMYHESTGSLLHQLDGGDGFVTCTTSVLIVLQQVQRRCVTEKVARVEMGKTKPSAKLKATAPVAKKGLPSTSGADVQGDFEWISRDVFEPCTGESGRPVRSQLFKLNSPFTAAQRANCKRVPRDATKALFATEPLTPRRDGSRGSSQSGSQTGSPRTGPPLARRLTGGRQATGILPRRRAPS